MLDSQTLQSSFSNRRGKHGKQRANWGLVFRVLSIVAIVACAAVLVFSLAATDMSLVGALKLVVLIPLYVLLPGYVVARYIADRDCPSQLIAYCITFSVIFLLVFYFADELLTKTTLFGFAEWAGLSMSSLGIHLIADRVAKGVLFGVFGSPLISLVSVVFLVRDCRKGIVSLNSFRLDVRVLAMIAVAMVISFFSIYMYISVPVEKIGSTTVYFDQAWLTSNDAAVALGWPADGFQYLGKRLNSNIFANLFRASLSRASGFSAAQMYGICSAFIATPFCIIAVNALGNRFLKDANKALFATFAFVFVRFFSVAIIHFYNINKAASIAQAQTAYFNSAMTNVLRSPNGIDLALPVVAVAIVLLLQISEAKRPRVFQFVSLFAVAALLTGAKYVFMVCVICAVFGTIVIRVIRDRSFDSDSRILAVAGVVVVTAFVLVFFTVVRGGEVYAPPTEVQPLYAANAEYDTYYHEGYEYSGLYSELSIGAIVTKSQLFSSVKSIFFIPDKADAALAIVLIPLHFALSMVLVAVPFLLWVVSKIRRFKTVSVQEMLFAGMAVSGMLIYYLIRVDGSSQAYFFFCSSLFVSIIGAGWVYEGFPSLKWLWRAVLATCLAIGLASTIAVSVGWMKPGVINLRDAVIGYTAEKSAPTYNRITDYEYAAMKWIRDNTPPDAVLAVDRHYSQKVSKDVVPEPNQYASKYYYYTAYSERQAFIGSWAYMPRTAEMQQQIVERLIANDALYNNACLNRRELMEKNGISYIVVSRFVNPGLVLEDRDLIAVYRNRDITVYALSQKVG